MNDTPLGTTEDELNFVIRHFLAGTQATHLASVMTQTPGLTATQIADRTSLPLYDVSVWLELLQHLGFAHADTGRYTLTQSGAEHLSRQV